MLRSPLGMPRFPGEPSVPKKERERGRRRPAPSESGLVLLTGAGKGEAPPCQRCPARCCKYFALEIDRPTTPKDHDQIRWYLLHRDVVVWVQDGEWYLEVRNRCRELLDDDRCDIYETRPEVCREYGWPVGSCEHYEEDLRFDHHFESAEQFEAWSKVELEKRERRLARRRERERRRRGRARGRREAIA